MRPSLVASYFAKRGSIKLLGNDATEKAIRGYNLRDFRVISFATHGLVAGEFEGIAEPALVLTPGSEGDADNDGLLTMSEISNMALDTDIVVLSACNTALPSGLPNAKGLGGLISAFTFAGARSVLASQWPVYSTAATQLTTAMFDHVERGKDLSESFQLAMLDSIANAKSTFDAHPRFWAPFMLTGEGSLAPGRSVERTVAGSFGELEWQEELGDKVYGEVMDLAAAKGGGYYVSGIGDPVNARATSYVDHRSTTGQRQWRIPGDQVSWRELTPTVDGGTLMQGSIFSDEKGAGAVLAKVSSSGKIEWKREIDSLDFDNDSGLSILPNGNLVWLVHQITNGGSRPPVNQLHFETLSQGGKLLGSAKYQLTQTGYISQVLSRMIKNKFSVAVSLTADFIKATFGIDLVSKDVEKIPHPAGVLDEVCKSVGARYRKRKDEVEALVSRLDFEKIYLDDRLEIPALNEFLTEIDFFMNTD